jgi:hypothetical protein
MRDLRVIRNIMLCGRVHNRNRDSAEAIYLTGGLQSLSVSFFALDTRGEARSSRHCHSCPSWLDSLDWNLPRTLCLVANFPVRLVVGSSKEVFRVKCLWLIRPFLI